MRDIYFVVLPPLKCDRNGDAYRETDYNGWNTEKETDAEEG
tara:strand:- start:1917 stop:2039 length:123 start_codon:yes stop_codon:yes gene_type:complete